jgi:predicted RNA-binding Zn-ribbon protein involved in translation (DUF1610 family)
MRNVPLLEPVEPEFKVPTTACSNYVHYQLLLDTDVERCPNCGRKLWRSPRSKCAAHAVYACHECYSIQEIVEFALKREFGGRHLP